MEEQQGEFVRGEGEGAGAGDPEEAEGQEKEEKDLKGKVDVVLEVKPEFVVVRERGGFGSVARGYESEADKDKRDKLGNL